METKNTNILRILERVFGWIAVIAFGGIALWSLSLGGFGLFFAFVLLISPVGLVGDVALLIWAILRSIRATKEERMRFFKPNISAFQGVMLTVTLVVALIIFYLLFS